MTHAHSHKPSRKATEEFVGAGNAGWGTDLYCATPSGVPGHGAHIITDVCSCGAYRVVGGSPICRPRWVLHAGCR